MQSAAPLNNDADLSNPPQIQASGWQEARPAFYLGLYLVVPTNVLLFFYAIQMVVKDGTRSAMAMAAIIAQADGKQANMIKRQRATTLKRKK